MSETYGPFDVRAGILQRTTRLVDLIVRQRPGTTALQLYRASSLSDAYGGLYNSGISAGGGLTVIGSATADTMYKSSSVVWKVEEYRRGQTSFVFNPEDLGVVDDNYYYCRVQEQRGGNWLAVPGTATHNANAPILGPILILPPPLFFGAAAYVMSLQATAPQNTGSSAGAAPVIDPTVQTALPMHMVLPRPAATATINNLASASTDSLLVCFGLGQPMVQVAPGGSITPTGGGYALPGLREIIVAAASTAAAPVPFSIETVVGFETG